MRFVMPVFQMIAAAMWLLSLGVPHAWGQGRGIIPVHSSFERAYAIVPMQGRFGSFDDPPRPMFVPVGGFRQNVRSVVDRT